MGLIQDNEICPQRGRLGRKATIPESINASWEQLGWISVTGIGLLSAANGNNPRRLAVTRVL